MLQQASLTTWEPSRAPDDDGAFLRTASRQLARQYGLDPARVEVGYRRYTTLKSTARQASDGRLVVSLSDEVRADPPQSRAAIAMVLGARVLRKRPPQWAREAYSAWLADPEVRERALQVRARRARRRTGGVTGRYHDLQATLDRVGRVHFEPALAPPPVAWTVGAARAVLASFDEAHAVITVSRLLDHPRVAPATIEYLLYHEMLHYEDFLQERAQAPMAAPRKRTRRRRVHPRSFIERLHRFPQWQEAERDLERALRRRRDAVGGQAL